MTIQINGTSGISGVDGSATTPAFQGTDTNTGISFGTDEVNVVTGGSTRMRITSGDEIMVGHTSAVSGHQFMSFRIESGEQGMSFEGDSSSGRVAMTFRNTNGEVGYITMSGSATSYNTSSDYRLKENVVDLDGAITRVKQLAPKRFNFIVDANKTVDGFLAHEVQGIVPEAITGEKDAVDDEGNPEYQGIDQSKLVPLLTAALQEAIAKIETLETRVAQLEGGAS